MYVAPDQWKYNCIILLAYINGASAASDYGGYLFVLNVFHSEMQNIIPVSCL